MLLDAQGNESGRPKLEVGRPNLCKLVHDCQASMTRGGWNLGQDRAAVELLTGTKRYWTIILFDYVTILSLCDGTLTGLML